MIESRLSMLQAPATALLLAAACAAGEADGALHLRRKQDGKFLPASHAIPAAGTRAFTYEGRPDALHVTDRLIAVRYRTARRDISGVLFDRATGKAVRRHTGLDGWPKVRPAAFGPAKPPSRPLLVGPGVLYEWGEEGLGTVASADFAGRTFRAVQPYRFLRHVPRERGQRFCRWTTVLTDLNGKCRLEAGQGERTRRYTMSDGLAGNIVTHLAAAGGVLWAACVDIWDDEKKAWGTGGLCRYDAGKDRWVRVETVAGRAVRWVTLLAAVGDDLWVGFREGKDLEGDRVVYGMGLYPGHYRPRTTAVVLARLSGGRWSAWSRAPAGRPGRGAPGGDAQPPSSTEVPRRLAVVGGGVLLYSTTRSARRSGNWEVPLDGLLSRLDLPGGTWRAFDARRDLSTHRLVGLHVQGGEALALSETGAHQWDGRAGRWRRLDPHCALVNPQFGDAAAVGGELWVGYTAEGFWHQGRQGISRYDEKAGRWTYMPPRELGTSCPVRSIAAGPDGAAWVLFRRREWLMAMEAMSGPAEPGGVECVEGLGRFADGRWSFPLTLPGVPQTVATTWTTAEGPKTVQVAAPITDIVRVGDGLFVASAAGVFAGPGSWRKVVAGPVLGIATGADGRTLEIVRACDGPEQGPRTFERGTCDPRTGRTVFAKCPPGELDFYSYQRRRQEFYRRDGALASNGPWVPIPAEPAGEWFVGPVEAGGAYRAVATAHAVWIASPGQLIRIGRDALAAARAVEDGR